MMKTNYLHLFLLVFLNLVATYTFSQKQGQNQIEITGQVIDQNSGSAIPYATIALKDKTTKDPIKGVVTDANGNFKVNVGKPNFYIEISFIGYLNKTINEFEIINSKINIGVIALSMNSQSLDKVVIEGETSEMIFKLDKRVFNVGKDLSSTGASALEVLNNVPSVNVDIEGEISLRGKSGVQILIDGKPSVLADSQSGGLGTITADMIESIEVITNPSAKNDAEGTSGIINIILKKNEKEGLNGSISLNTGIPDNHSIGISLNRRTEKFNLFTQLGAGYRSLPRYSESSNIDLLNNTQLNSEGTSFRNEAFYNVTLGADYHIDSSAVITLSGNFAYEIENQPSATFFSYYDQTELISEWERNEATEATNPKYQYDLNYKKEFKNNKDHTLLFSTLGRFFGKEQSSTFKNTYSFGNEATSFQQTNTNFNQANYTFKIDYTQPILEKFTIETGAQYVINNVGNEYEVRDQIDNVYVVDPNLSNNFKFDQEVFAAYGTTAYEEDKWGVKLGLRVENTDVVTLLENTNDENKRNYTNFFPSLHTSRKFSDKLSLQAGYSRRIYRPRLWDLNPFFNIRNNFNVRTGNPNLQPEFTDSYEITSIFSIGKATLNASIFHLFTEDVIERINQFEDGINITTPSNIGTNQATGFEINGKYRPMKLLTITGDANINYFVRKGEFNSQSFDFTGNKWSTRIGTQFKLPKDFDVEITGNFNSKYETVQGNSSGYASLDLGLRKKILKGKAIINVSIRDLFESRISENFTYQESFDIYSYSQRGRFMTLGLSYGFGKGEAMTYSGGRRR